MLSASWLPLLGEDAVPWVLASAEPGARWLVLTGVLGRPADDPQVRREHAAVLDDAGTRALLDRLPDWAGGERFSGHDSPAFAPNLLNLLADLGVRGGEAPQVERLLDQMLAHQEPDGRFASFTATRASESPVWGALPCDHHAVTEVLMRFGRGTDARVQRGLERMAADLADTAQGRAWRCLPHTATGWRGPGRKGDFCPMVTLQALRAFARAPARLRPPHLDDAARVVLAAWGRRGEQQPHMFGHGKRFKTVKWWPTWYSTLSVLDGLAGYPDLWRDAAPGDPDRRALAELLACLLAYNVGADGRVVPRSAFRDLTAFSFAQKSSASALATARVLAVVAAFDDLADDVAAVDVGTLGSSKGGTGTAVPPPRSG